MARRKKHLTTDDLMRHGVGSQGYAHDLLHGRRKPSLALAIKLYEGLGIKPTEWPMKKES